MHSGPFLELMQLVDAGRKVRGRESMEIKDVDVDRAKGIDESETAHAVDVAALGHPEPSACETCRGIQFERAILRNTLQSQGQDIPGELLGG